MDVVLVDDDIPEVLVGCTLLRQGCRRHREKLLGLSRQLEYVIRSLIKYIVNLHTYSTSTTTARKQLPLTVFP